MNIVYTNEEELCFINSSLPNESIPFVIKRRGILHTGSIILNQQKRLPKHLRIAMKKPTDVTTGRFLPYAFDEAFADLSVPPIPPAYSAA